MYDQVLKIAKHSQEIGFNSTNHGLLNGNTGLSIFFYNLALKTGISEYEKFADSLLDRSFSNLSSSASPDFENGLAGIGWGIEYLVQNKFAEGNTDEILEEVDNKVFRSLNEETHTSFELTTGLTGYLYYLIMRLKNKLPPHSMPVKINRELLILTINKIDEQVTVQFPSIVKDMNFDLFWRFPTMLSGLKDACDLNIYNEKIICMLKQWLPYFEAYIPSLHINRIFIAVAINRINLIFPDKRLKKQIRILLFATDFEILKTEVNNNEFGVRFGWPGVLFLLKVASQELPSDCPNFNLIENTYFEIKQNHKESVKNISGNFINGNSFQLGLASGPAGIGMLELFWNGILSADK